MSCRCDEVIPMRTRFCATGTPILHAEASFISVGRGLRRGISSWTSLKCCIHFSFILKLAIFIYKQLKKPAAFSAVHSSEQIIKLSCFTHQPFPLPFWCLVVSSAFCELEAFAKRRQTKKDRPFAPLWSEQQWHNVKLWERQPKRWTNKTFFGAWNTRIQVDVQSSFVNLFVVIKIWIWKTVHLTMRFFKLMHNQVLWIYLLSLRFEFERQFIWQCDFHASFWLCHKRVIDSNWNKNASDVKLHPVSNTCPTLSHTPCASWQTCFIVRHSHVERRIHDWIDHDL